MRQCHHTSHAGAQAAHEMSHRTFGAKCLATCQGNSSTLNERTCLLALFACIKAHHCEIVVCLRAFAFRPSAFNHLSVLSKDLQLSALSCSISVCNFAMATCEYEMLRQQKIADNRKRMESLGLQKVRAASNMGS